MTHVGVMPSRVQALEKETGIREMDIHNKHIHTQDYRSLEKIYKFWSNDGPQTSLHARERIA